MAKKQILQQGGDGTAVPTGMIGYLAISSSLTKTTAALATWEKVTGDFGTPAAGAYLLIATVESIQTTSLTQVGAIVNETSGSVTPVVAQVQGAASASATPRSSFVQYYTTNGTKTLYAWVRSDGATTSVTLILQLIRIA
jgi:hypothetical protein